MKYSLTFGRNSQLIWALILPAFILLFPLLYILDYALTTYPDQGDIIVIVGAILYLGLDIWLTMYWVKSTTTTAEITIDMDTVEFHFLKKNIFHRSDFILHINDIKNIGEDTDKGYSFLYFECRNVKYSKFFIRADENNPDFEPFRQKILSMESEFNKLIAPELRITHKGLYQKTPMIVLAFVLFFFWFAFPVIMIAGVFRWVMLAKFITFVVVSSPIIIKVYAQNYAKTV